MNNLVTRTITGTIFVSLIVCSLIFHPIFLGILSILINYIALMEFNNLGQKFKLPVLKYWVVVNTFFLLVSIAMINLGFSPKLAVLPFLMIPVVLSIYTIFIKVNTPALHLAFILFGTVYISLPMLLLNFIQQDSLAENIPFALAVFIIIWTNDTFAYLSGILLGKHKILKRISPLKSWEGLIGGLLSVIPVVLIFNHFYPHFGIGNWITFGFITAIFSVLGDFLESMIKRNAGIKDTGKLLPGHGGMLDRVDSLLLAFPVIFIYLHIVLIT